MNKFISFEIIRNEKKQTLLNIKRSVKFRQNDDEINEI